MNKVSSSKRIALSVLLLIGTIIALIINLFKNTVFEEFLFFFFLISIAFFLYSINTCDIKIEKEKVSFYYVYKVNSYYFETIEIIDVRKFDRGVFILETTMHTHVVNYTKENYEGCKNLIGLSAASKITVEELEKKKEKAFQSFS